MQNFVDLKNGAVIGQSLRPVANNANANGAGVDLINGEGRTQMIVNLGVLDANTVYYVQAEESSDNTTFTTPADTTNTNTGNLSTSNTVTTLSFQRGKRYVRGKVTIAGTNAAGLISITVIEQKRDEGNNIGYSNSPAS